MGEEAVPELDAKWAEAMEVLVEDEVGERVRWSATAAQSLGVRENLLVGLAQRKHVAAHSRQWNGDYWVWFFPVSELDRLKGAMQGG